MGALIVLWAFTASAAPVLTVLIDPAEPGAGQFSEDLRQVWHSRNTPTPHRLAVVARRGDSVRLRLANRGRGDFAIIDTASATTALARYENLAAVGLLWPSYLHAVTTSTTLKSLGLPPAGDVVIGESAGYVHEGLLEWIQDRGEIDLDLKLVPDARKLLQPDSDGDAASVDENRIVVFSAPAPLEEVAALFSADSSLRMLPVAGALIEELRLLYPWLQTETLPRSTYPGMGRPMVLPARYLLMTGRRDLPEAAVRKMLDSLYRRKRALALYNPLFGTLNRNLNALFARLFPFHPVSARLLGLPAAN